MAVISITITQSEEQVVSGIPRFVTIEANIPSSIFYTVDGTQPTLFSNIYTGTLYLPYDTPTVTLSVFATNGVDSSSIVVEQYASVIINNARLPHSSTTQDINTASPSEYPFGSNPLTPNTQYLNPADSGTVINDPNKTRYASGFDSDGYPAAYTNLPYNQENYEILYTTRDAQGKPVVGTLPAQVTITPDTAPPSETEQFSNMFDPRAMVIFQDFSKENPNDPPQINSQFFSLENKERARDGNSFYTTGLDAPPVNGSFVRSHFNPRDNTITYYYLDTWANRWIISKSEYKPTGSFNGNISTMFVGTGNAPGGRYVYEWPMWQRRTLF